MFYRILCSLTVVLPMAMITLLGASSIAQADEYAGKQWPASQLVSFDQIDHSSFDSLLKKYVNTDGMVNYRAWHASANDRQILKGYLESLGKADSSQRATREATMAYWINAYNALTLEGILRVYPTSSIRNHTAKLVGYNIWKKLHLYVGHQQVTLDHIEHQILRPMGEPRVHFAIVCASIGCPRLLNEAYVSDRLAQQLATNTVDFFSRQQNLQTDSQGTLYLSQIISWFGKDFGRSPQEQIQYLLPYFPQSAKDLVARGGYRVQYLNYNWDLNAQN